ncbi:MAG: hypothetical protein ACRDCT_03410, partial [Shewanella sp.]
MVQPHPCLSRSGWHNHARLLGFATLCANLQITLSQSCRRWDHQLITFGDNASSDFTCKNADPRVGIFKKLAVGRTVWVMFDRYHRAIYPLCPPHRQVWQAVCHT